MTKKLIKIIEHAIETGVAFWITVLFSEKIQYEGIQSLLPWQKLAFYFLIFATTLLFEKTMSWVIKNEINGSAERMGKIYSLLDPTIGKAVSIVVRILMISMFAYVGFKKFT